MSVCQKGKCSICSEIKELNTSEMTPVCEECYNEHKCSVCLDLIDEDSRGKIKLFGDYQCCKEVKLCMSCHDIIKSRKTVSCPVCKYTPSIIKEPVLSPFLTELIDCLEWINNQTSKHYNNYYVSLIEFGIDININIKQFYEYIKSINRPEFKLEFFLIRYDFVNDILETQIHYKLSEVYRIKELCINFDDTIDLSDKDLSHLTGTINSIFELVDEEINVGEGFDVEMVSPHDPYNPLMMNYNSQIIINHNMPDYIIPNIPNTPNYIVPIDVIQNTIHNLEGLIKNDIQVIGGSVVDQDL